MSFLLEVEITVWAALSGDHVQLKKSLENLQERTIFQAISNNNNNESDFFSELTDERGHNLIYLAIESQSLECVQIVLQFYELSSNLHDNRIRNESLHYAITLNSSHEILNILVDFYLKILENDNYWPFHMAIEKNDMKLIKFLVEKYQNLKPEFQLNFFFLASVMKKSFNNREILEYLCENFAMKNFFSSQNRLHSYNHRTERDLIPENVLNMILSKFYIEESGELSACVIQNMFLTLNSGPQVRSEYKNWMIKKIYLNKTNEFRSLIYDVLNSGIKHTHFVYNIIFFLHSKLRGKGSALLQLIMSDRSEPNQLRWNYFYLYETMLIDRNLYKKIIKIANDLYCDDDKKCYRIQTIDNIPLFVRSTYYEKDDFYDNYIEFLDDIQMQKLDFLSFFKNCSKFYELYVGITSFMPFMAISCADELIPTIKSNCISERHRVKHFPPRILKYFGQSRQNQPMELMSMCRIVIRKSVFESQPKLSNEYKLKRIHSLPLPKILKNFLFFNYTNYDLCKN